MKPKKVEKDKNLKASPRPDMETKELSEEELEDISGGKVRMNDFHFVKKIDKATPSI